MLDLFKIWQGGLVAYGGMIGGFLASWYGCHKRKIPLLKWADVSAPSVVLGRRSRPDAHFRCRGVAGVAIAGIPVSR